MVNDMDDSMGGINFELNQDQQMLQNLARDFAAQRDPAQS